MRETHLETRRLRRRSRSVVAAMLFLLSFASAVSAQTPPPDEIYFPAVQNVTNILVQRINAETVRLDIATWYLSEHAISIAIANRHAAGVPVRLIGDRGAIFEGDVNTRADFYWLASQGVPIRLRFNPTWFPEIIHWKAAIFVGQNTVAFGSANFAPAELAPNSSTDYDDETVMFAHDPVLVNAFKSRFDRIWNDTTPEPQSVYGPPPYLKNWDDACTLEPTGRCDYFTQYPNRVRMTISTARLELPECSDTILTNCNPTPPELIWGQGPDFNNRLTQEIYNESSRIDLVVYRLGVDNITQALLDKHAAGVPVRVIVDKNQYTNPLYPEYWLTHANIDKLWVAGIPVKANNHAGISHMKTLITSTYAGNASSNFSPNWQRDHDYFVPKATKPGVYQAIADRFDIMWNDTAGFGPLVTTGPAAAALATPTNGGTSVSTTPTLIWNRAAWAVSYDVYLGAAGSPMTFRANVPAVMSPNPPNTYTWSPSTALAGGTTYFWKIVSRTNATVVNPNMIATSDTWSFTTAGGPPPPPPGNLPSPWVTQGVGSPSPAGNASFSNGVFTVNGGGADIWGTADSFQYVSQSMTGDFTLVARITSMGNTSSFAKAGIMLRTSTAANAAHVMLDVRPTGDLEFMTRSSSGAATTFLGTAAVPMPLWLRLARSGTSVSASVSADGATWTAASTTTLSGSTLLAGLIVCSHSGSLNTSTFDNVTVTGGAPPPPPPPPPPPGVPSPWVSQDVGAASPAGSASFSNGVFTVNGAGADIWGTADAFQFVNQPISGDLTLVARVTTVENTSPVAKAGIMLRTSTAAGSAHVILDLRPTGDIEFMTRGTTGAATTWLNSATQFAPAWLRLVRSGSTVTASVSANGSTWSTVGSTTFNSGTVLVGLVVCAHDATLNTSTFDNVSVTGGAPPPPPPPPPNVVIYASDIPAGARHGSMWATAADGLSPNGTKLVTSDTGFNTANNALASPTQYVDVTFTANANTPYTFWMRMQALNNSTGNDSVWVQFNDATISGSPAYRIGTTVGLLVNLASDSSGSSLNGWGWRNTAWWLSQTTTVSFPTTGTHTLRIQIREDGVQFDQIVLSPGAYLTDAPGLMTGDQTIVPKP